jgi:hypothetical protein
MKIAAAAYPLDFLQDWDAYEEDPHMGGPAARDGPIFWCSPNTGAWSWPRSTARRPRAIWSGAFTPPPAGPKRPTR